MDPFFTRIADHLEAAGDPASDTKLELRRLGAYFREIEEPAAPAPSPGTGTEYRLTTPGGMVIVSDRSITASHVYGIYNAEAGTTILSVEAGTEWGLKVGHVPSGQIPLDGVPGHVTLKDPLPTIADGGHVHIFTRRTPDRNNFSYVREVVRIVGGVYRQAVSTASIEAYLDQLVQLPTTAALTAAADAAIDRMRFQAHVETIDNWQARYGHPELSQPDYGRQIASLISDAALALHFPVVRSHAVQAVRQMIQIGVDSAAYMGTPQLDGKGNFSYPADGGHGNGRLYCGLLTARFGLTPPPEVGDYGETKQSYVNAQGHPDWRSAPGGESVRGDGSHVEKYRNIAIPSWMGGVIAAKLQKLDRTRHATWIATSIDHLKWSGAIPHFDFTAKVFPNLQDAITILES